VLAVGFLLSDKFVAPLADDSPEIAATTQKQTILELRDATIDLAVRYSFFSSKIR
jgi:hypothetical protein